MAPPKTKKIGDLIHSAAAVKTNLRPASSRRPPQKMSPPALPTRHQPSQKTKRQKHPAGPSPTTVKQPQNIVEPPIASADSESGDDVAEPDAEVSEPDENALTNQQEEPVGEVEYLQPGEELPRPRVKKPRSNVSRKPAAPVVESVVNNVPARSASQVVVPPPVANLPTPAVNNLPDRIASQVVPPPVANVPAPAVNNVPTRNASQSRLPQSSNASQSQAHSSPQTGYAPPPPPLSLVPMPSSSRAPSQNISDAHPDEENPPANVEIVRSIRCKPTHEGIDDHYLNYVT